MAISFLPSLTPPVYIRYFSTPSAAWRYGAGSALTRALYSRHFFLSPRSPVSFSIQPITDALGAGLLLIPQGLGSLASRTVAGRFLDRVGGRNIALVGFVIVGLATVPFAFADADTPFWMLAVALFVRGLGLGVVIIPLMAVAFIGLEHDEVPHASVVTRISQQIGGSLGVALLAVILTTAATAAGSIAVGFQTGFWWTVGFSALSIAVALILPGKKKADAITGAVPTAVADEAVDA